MLEQRLDEFDTLIAAAHACRLCPRMCDSVRVLNRGCGPLDAAVMVIGEAPGRLGADASGIPFHGDKAGHNFESLIAQVGLSRSSLFITNSVLCNPKDDAGNNSTPTTKEVANCSAHLREQINLLQPAFVVTLGAVALRAVGQLEDHGLTLSTAVRTATPWLGRVLVPLYHPGQRAMIHRSFANQLADYQFLAELVRRGRSKKKVQLGSSRSDVTEVVRYLLTRFGEISYFRLHKAMYLAELRYVAEHGERMTSAYFVRQKDGPYSPDLHPQRLSNAGLPLLFSANKGTVALNRSKGDLFSSEQPVAISSQVISAIDWIYEKYSTSTDAQLKTAAYLSKPMRALLALEKCGSNQFNAPVPFG